MDDARLLVPELHPAGALHDSESGWRPTLGPLFQWLVAARRQVRPAAASAVVSLRHGAGRPERPDPGAKPSAHRAGHHRLRYALYHDVLRRPHALSLYARWPADAALRHDRARARRAELPGAPLCDLSAHRDRRGQLLPLHPALQSVEPAAR